MPKKTLLSQRSALWVTLAIILIPVILAGFLIWSAFAAGTLLVVNGPTTAVKPGDQFTVTVRVNSGTTGINAVGIRLNYDPSKVDFVSASNVNSPFTVPYLSNASAGVVSVDEAIDFGAALVTGDQLASTITFTAKAGISGSMALSFAATSQVYDGSSQNILTSVTNQTTGATITFQAPANPPTISLTTNGTSFTAPATVELMPNVTVDPSRTITKVEYYSGSNIIGTRSVSPWSFSWTNVPAGTYALSAKVTDSAGGFATSNSVNISVGQAPAPPSVTLTTNGTTFTSPATVVLTATATASTGRSITKVDFFRGTTLLGTDTTAPYSYTLSNVAQGTYTYHATATDNGSPGLTGDSTNVTVTVGSPPPTPPSAPTNLHVVSGSITSSGVTIAWDDMINPTGTTYRVIKDGTQLPTVITGKSFADSGLAPQTTHTYSVKAFSADGSLSSAATASISATTSALPPLIGDINGDRKVDGVDFAMLFQKWGTADSAADLNSNGLVDGFDFVLLFKNFGKTG